MIVCDILLATVTALENFKGGTYSPTRPNAAQEKTALQALRTEMAASGLNYQTLADALKIKRSRILATVYGANESKKTRAKIEHYFNYPFWTPFDEWITRKRIECNTGVDILTLTNSELGALLSKLNVPGRGAILGYKDKMVALLQKHFSIPPFQPQEAQHALPKSPAKKQRKKGK